MKQLPQSCFDKVNLLSIPPKFVFYGVKRKYHSMTSADLRSDLSPFPIFFSFPHFFLSPYTQAITHIS
jgi:hypothetical protein